jgi:outer membrane protein assembly factor BamB
MKPNIKTFLVGAGLLALSAVISCKKDATTAPSTNTNPTSPTGPTSLLAFHNANRVPVQSFTINNSTGATIKGANGGKYFIPAHFFVNSANQAISGNITVNLKEIFTPANMILSNMPTMAGNRGLLSDGEFNITANQNNQPLKAAVGAMFAAHLPLKADSAVDSINVWNFNNNTWANSFGSYAYSIGPDSICINSDSINWLNGDYFYPNSAFYQLNINAPNAPNITQTCIYVYVNGHRAIWQSSFVSGTEFQTPTDIPAGAPLTIIGLCTASDGTLYSFFYPYTNPGSNDNITVNFTATTTSAFTAALQAL